MIRFHERFASYSPLSPTPSTSARHRGGQLGGAHVVITQWGRGWQIRF